MSSRRTSLFAFDHPSLDHGISVVCHADHPRNEYPPHTKQPHTERALNQMEEPPTFNDDMVRHLIREVLEYRLNGIEYRKKESDELCTQITKDVRGKIAVLDYRGYKIVCSCILSSINKPPFWLQSSCTWNGEITNTDKDRFVELVFKNKEFYAVVTVYGMFHPRYFRRKDQRESLFSKD